MAALTVQHVVDAGTAPNFATDTPTVSDTADIGTGTNTVVEYKNSDGTSKTITITNHYVLDTGDTGKDHVVTLAATTGNVRIPLRKSYDNGTGSADIALSSVTGVTVALVRLG